MIGCDAGTALTEFAEEAARVLAGAGLRVHLLPLRQPTPLLAFAVTHLAAAAGIMITASHNPPADNGYKLYLADGVQIIPPADAEIEAAIRALGPLAQVPVAESGSPLIIRHGDEVAGAYLAAVTATFRAPTGAARLRFVYTPLHGVAAGLALRAFERAGFPAPGVVAAQAAPDPDFPTLSYPNPEEPGALDLALAQAREFRRRPGDRQRPGRRPAGGRRPGSAGRRRLAGADRRPARRAARRLRSGTHIRAAGPAAPAGRHHGGLRDPAGRIAAAAGVRYAETLTGFKWIVRAADHAAGLRFTFGYEEALGYTIGTAVRDKDGIGAALAVLSLAARARSAGDSLLDAYDALEVAHGVHVTGQLTLRTDAPGQDHGAAAGLAAGGIRRAWRSAR